MLFEDMQYQYTMTKGIFKGGGVSGGSKPPKIFRFFLKSEGKEIERKKEVLRGGGELPLNIFLGLIFFRVGLIYFQGGLRNYRGVEKFSGGVEKFSWGLRNFRRGG